MKWFKESTFKSWFVVLLLLSPGVMAYFDSVYVTAFMLIMIIVFASINRYVVYKRTKS